MIRGDEASDWDGDEANEKMKQLDEASSSKLSSGDSRCEGKLLSKGH